MRLRWIFTAFALFSVVAHGQPQSETQHESDGIMLYPAAALKWRDGPPSLPKWSQIAVLEGDPAKDGPFVFRLKIPDGYRVPPHTHPKTERITVISGTFNVGMGETASGWRGGSTSCGRKAKRCCSSMGWGRGLSSMFGQKTTRAGQRNRPKRGQH